MTHHNYTVELLITGTNGKTRIANWTRSGWDMTPSQACRKAVEYVTLYWPNVAEAKALRVHIDGKGWTDPAGASSAQAQTHEAKHG